MSAKRTTVSILGCGWLGLPLAGHLLSMGVKVLGSYTSTEKQNELRKWNIEGYSADMTRPESINPTFLSSETLVITVPPSKGGKEFYASHLEQLLVRAKEAGCSKVFFTSSTAVYPESSEIQTELSAVQEYSSRGNNMLAAEQAILKIYPTHSTILRLGGLIGPKRHPGRFLSGKTDVAGASVPVNFLSLEDGVRMLTELVIEQRTGKVYNLVCPPHPTKEEYYSLACGLKDLPSPQFDPALSQQGYKLVDGNLITRETGIEYLTLDWKSYLKSL